MRHCPLTGCGLAHCPILLQVINFYLNLIVERGQSSESVCRVHAMSSFFYPKLRNAGYSGVRRWTKKVQSVY